MSGKKKEILEKSLKCFVENGLTKTTFSVLVKHIEIPRSLVYYYFQSKDELVIACAEEAAKRLEDDLMTVAVKNIKNLDDMFEKLQSRAFKNAPLMKFLASVASSVYYGDKIKPALKAFAGRYDKYAEQIATKLDISIDVIRPLVYITILSMTNYMIFEEETMLVPLIEEIKTEFYRNTGIKA